MPAPPPPVEYRDRRTGLLVREPVMAESLMRWLYGHPLGAPVVSVVRRPFISNWMGRWQDRHVGQAVIRRFAAAAGIDLSEVRDPLTSFNTLNGFFSRHLKPEARPIDPAPERLISLSDGKLLVFPAIHHGQVVPVKGAPITISRLLMNPDLAARFDGGAALVLRLAPGDYHRFHFVDSGVPGPSVNGGRGYDTVNPIGLHCGRPILTENRRAISTLSTDGFGLIASIEVGALFVGSIVQTYTPGTAVVRGAEKGYFQFGGSTVIQLFEPGRVTFDADLVSASADGLETAVRCGEAIGSS